MNFFEEDEGDKPYKSFQDWIDDIRHLIWPTIIMAVLIIALLIYINYFY